MWSCALSFNCIWLQILFCSYVNETTLAPSCDHADRFADLAESDLACLLDQKNSGNTKKATKRRPQKGVDKSDEAWYDSIVVGQCTLGEKMKRFCIEEKLSFVYTNHSIRVTTITILDESGYEARHIMAVSGHRNESSIRNYSSQTCLSTKRKLSETLSESLNSKKTVNYSEIPAVGECTATTSYSLSRRAYS